jgi:hypothetical protein
MFCKYLSKSLNGKLKCKLFKTITYIDNCKKCLKNEPRANKGIKKVSSKRKKLESHRFSIFTNNLKQCFYCKKTHNKMDLHEVYGGSNRTRSMINGLVVPLCRECHSNESIINQLRIDLQKEYEKTHARQEFIELIGKNYIK